VVAVGAGCAGTWPWEPTREEVLQRLLPSSVQIVVERDGRRFRTGSGVAIAARPSMQGADCFVLTSGHLLSRLSDGDQVSVLFGRDHGSGTKRRAMLLAQRDTEEMDLALLRAEAGECTPAPFGEPPGLGEPVWVVAFPWGRNMRLVGGIVSQVNSDQPGDRDAAPRLIVDASVSYGASGGGVYDGRGGRLVGLVEGYRTARVALQGSAPPQYVDVPVPGETYVVPLADIRRFLTETDHADLIAPTARDPQIRE
jgi:serine protease Do